MPAFLCFIQFFFLNYTSRQTIESLCAYILKVAEYTFKLALSERNKTKSHVNKIDSVLLRIRKIHVTVYVLYI